MTSSSLTVQRYDTLISAPGIMILSYSTVDMVYDLAVASRLQDDFTMTDRLKRFFEEELLPASDADEYERAVGIQYATAALLIEVAKADSEQDDVERAVINAMLQDAFDLDDDMLEKIVELADEATSAADGVFQFTAMVNDHYGQADKKKLVEYLWVVAFADGRLDRYEEQFITKVAGLLDLSDEDLAEAKAIAQER